ncbi:MAG: Spy/CpxP family protein refolding chaperone [Gammaproteobacteria bacterium]|nr:Spy/CpxP family protein refolding chaperone [Gammaproteobacteria bacterium]MDH3407339.1 Spy/CpxP family protein refolding chaperone [Gammaproteobacteria bacterium]
MDRNLIKQWIPRVLAVATLAASGAAIAAEQGGPMMCNRNMSPTMQPGQMGYGMAPGAGMGMMGGGMMGMGGHGMGMGSGCGMGMGGSGMGMMGGGMMGGMGMGHGGGMGPVWMLDLTDDQRNQIEKIQNEARRKNWDTYGKIMDEQFKQRDLYSGETVDAKKAGAVYGNISKLQQLVLETNIESHNRMQAVLTKEQKEQLRQWSRGGMGGPGMMSPGGRGGYGPGNMPHSGMGMGPGMMHR